VRFIHGRWKKIRLLRVTSITQLVVLRASIHKAQKRKNVYRVPGVRKKIKIFTNFFDFANSRVRSLFKNNSFFEVNHISSTCQKKPCYTKRIIQIFNCPFVSVRQNRLWKRQFAGDLPPPSYRHWQLRWQVVFRLGKELKPSLPTLFPPLFPPCRRTLELTQNSLSSLPISVYFLPT